MPFQYTPSESRAAFTIGDIIRERGAQQARAAEQRGAIEAQATLQRGQAWAGAIRSVGQIPQEIEQAKRASQQDEAAGLQVESLKRQNDAGAREQKSLAVFEAALKDPKNYTDDGTINDAAVTAALKAQDVGAWQHWAEISAKNRKNSIDFAKSDADLKATQLGNEEKQRASAALKTNYMGNLAFQGERLLNEKPDDPLHARDTTMAAVARAAADGVITEPQAQDFIMRTAGASPQQIRQVFASFVTPEARAKAEKAVADNAKTTADASKTAAEATNLLRYGRATPPSLQTEKFRLDGKDVMGTFNPSTGAYQFQGEDVTARAKPIPTATAGQAANATSDVKEFVAGMKDGTLPPQMPGRASKEYSATMAEAHRQGYDLQAAVTDWNATQKHIASMNSATQLKLNQSINALPDLLDSVDSLASKWKGGRFPVLNNANLRLAKGGAYGAEVASVANQLETQIADVVADLGAVYMGGNSPTDHALGLASKSLNATWDAKVLHDMVKLAKANVTIRSNSIKNTGVAGASADNPYAPKTEAPAVQPTGRYNPATGKVEPIGAK